MPGSWREIATPRMLVRLSRPKRLARNLRLTAHFELLAQVTRTDRLLELRDSTKNGHASPTFVALAARFLACFLVLLPPLPQLAMP